jgi:hypothetical protein
MSEKKEKRETTKEEETLCPRAPLTLQTLSIS